jgi:hypothetical protein
MSDGLRKTWNVEAKYAEALRVADYWKGKAELAEAEVERAQAERRRLRELWAEVDDISMNSESLLEFVRLLEGQPNARLDD